MSQLSFHSTLSVLGVVSETTTFASENFAFTFVTINSKWLAHSAGLKFLTSFVRTCRMTALGLKPTSSMIAPASYIV